MVGRLDELPDLGDLRVALPLAQDSVGQFRSIKRRVLGSGKVAFDAKRSKRGEHSDCSKALVMACQRERVPV